MDLGKIEHGTFTGLRTFIDEYQRTPNTASDVMSSQIGEEVDGVTNLEWVHIVCISPEREGASRLYYLGALLALPYAYMTIHSTTSTWERI